MHGNYKIVCLTPAGRRRYMQYLIPQVITSEIVDRYDIWVNTTDKEDIYFFEEIARHYPKINLVWQPDGIVNGIQSINAFYKICIDEDTIYFKLDDDIVWMEPGLIEKMVEFRVNNPKYFLVSPLVINNALCTYILQVNELIKIQKYQNASASSAVLWKSGKFASDLHTWFLKEILNKSDYKRLYCGQYEFGLTRFSINAILWFGSSMKEFYGIVPGDDEEFLSCIYPTRSKSSNCINGDAVISHFAFWPQREMLDKQLILEQYGDYLQKSWKSSKGNELNVFNDIQDIIKHINANKSEIHNMPSRYPSMPKKRPKLQDKFRTFIKMILPLGMVNSMLDKRNNKIDWIL